MEESQSQSDSDTSCSLPEECVAHILSLTSPPDACAAAAVCRTFRSAADSDLVWDRFLPPDYKDILSRAVCRVAFSSKKELFDRLCRPLLIDGGTKSFCLDKTTGKKCFMVSAAGALDIAWEKPPRYWDLNFDTESRIQGLEAILLLPADEEWRRDDRLSGRNDGWFEVKIKEFCYDGQCEEVVKLMDIRVLFLIRGMILEGIELRPKN